MRISLTILALAALAACNGEPGQTNQRPSGAPATAQGDDSARLSLQPLRISTSRGARNFTVEMAISPQQQQRGLMYRTKLPEGTGMLFPFHPARAPSFWMKNTPLPLDMIFIAPDGRVAEVHADREPLSLEPTSTGAAMVAVLELSGGSAARLGIRPGDKVEWGQCPAPLPRPDQPWDRLSFCP